MRSMLAGTRLDKLEPPARSECRTTATEAACKITQPYQLHVVTQDTDRDKENAAATLASSKTRSIMANTVIALQLNKQTVETSNW